VSKYFDVDKLKRRSDECHNKASREWEAEHKLMLAKEEAQKAERAEKDRIRSATKIYEKEAAKVIFDVLSDVLKLPGRLQSDLFSEQVSVERKRLFSRYDEQVECICIANEGSEDHARSNPESCYSAAEWYYLTREGYGIYRTVEYADLGESKIFMDTETVIYERVEETYQHELSNFSAILVHVVYADSSFRDVGYDLSRMEEAIKEFRNSFVQRIESKFPNYGYDDENNE